jgi:hypothetical protein
MDTADVVRDLALGGSAHFHASYVAKKLGVSTEEAHERLAALEQEGAVEVHFDLICPETDRTIATYKLREEIPFGQFFAEKTGDCEPFEIAESDLLVTYSPTADFTRRLLRDGEPQRSKKKTTVWKRLLGTVFRRLRSTDGTKRDQSTFTGMSRSKPRSRRHRMAAQR